MGIGALLLVLMGALPAICQVSLSRGERDGQPVYVFENKYLKSEVAYTRGVSPISYFDKISGVEELSQGEPLSKNHGEFHGYGGVAEAVPWTGGAPYMGYLWTQEWEMTARTYEQQVVLAGEMKFPYPDPVTGKLCELRFQKITTAYDASTRLHMEYRIENIGERRVRFQHCVHGSPHIGGECDDADYFYAPGNRCWVVWSGRIPQYKIPDQSWFSWPIPEVIGFRKDSKEGLQLFVPAAWGVVGDDKRQEAMVMVNSPAFVGDKEIPVYIGYTTGGGVYYLEPSLTRHISNHADRWEREGYSVDLDTGETCTHTVDMAMFHGITKEQILSLYSLTGDYLLLREPSLKFESGEIRKAAVDLSIGVSGDAQLLVLDTASGQTLFAKELAPGKVAQIAEEIALPEEAGEIVVLLRNAAGDQVLLGDKDED